MFKSNNELYDLKCRVRDLEWELERTKEARDYFSSQAFELKKSLVQIARDSEVQIDFVKMNAFSIERLVDNKDLPQTVIGYFLTQGDGTKELREWFIQCNDTTHARLVSEFKDYVNSQRGYMDKTPITKKGAK